MRRFFYVLAFVATGVAVACGGAKKAGDKDETLEGVNQEVAKIETLESVNKEVAKIEAMIADKSAEEVAAEMNKRSYALGANMGLSVALGYGDMELNNDELKSAMLAFYESGDVEDETFVQNNEKFMAFIYMHFRPYMQAKQTRQIMEDGGITEDLPEIPELYTEEYTKEFVTNVLGAQMGASLKDVDGLDLAWLIKGFNDATSVDTSDMENVEAAVEQTLLITIDELKEELMSIQSEMMQKQQKKMIEAANEAAERSAAWLAEIEKEEGVKKTESGLLYRIERQGNGEFPMADTDRVTVHYEGTLSNGEVFDSSYERDETIAFPLNGVIKGWTEGLKLIDKGGEITLWIPSDLAYGERGAGPTIGPNEALKFKVELFGINE